MMSPDNLEAVLAVDTLSFENTLSGYDPLTANQMFSSCWEVPTFGDLGGQDVPDVEVLEVVES